MSEKDKHDLFIERLEEKYPQAFRNVYCGISINEGWYHIIESLVVNIRHHIKWRREMRARDLLQNRAYKKGREAVLKFISGDRVPTMWDENRVDEIMEKGLIEPAKKIRHIEVHQIKEKFGGLRFYYEGGDNEVHGMVRMAEAWAGYACETCGNLGKQRSGGWIRTLCDTHEEEYQQRLKRYKEED